MIGGRQRRIAETAARHVPPQMQAAIVGLAEAYDYARDVQGDLWDFAVEMDTLTAMGLTVDHLRRLLANGYIECRQEVTKPRDIARKFRVAEKPTFTNKTCFVVTEAGLRLTTTESARPWTRRAA